MKRWKKDREKNNFLLIFPLFPNLEDQNPKNLVFAHTPREEDSPLLSHHETTPKISLNMKASPSGLLHTQE